ncbi:MAG: hypothetical protein L0Y61_07930, partial [Epsilonproteobacteria bacterium]|nr:hypothetical protein [Campylobacterota bacterium]
NIALSDFISGSNFLGMVATTYDEFGSDTFEVFHSGNVSFGDAHIVIDGEMTYKVPLSFHNLKIGDECFNRLNLSDNEEKTLREEQKQLKQIRNGFMTESGTYTSTEYNYSQKSSYDRENRRSKDGGMYGYSALQKGTNWIFKIVYKDEKYISKIEEKLLGIKKLGKSKSSQYGQVEITKIDTPHSIETFIPNDNITYIYLNSRLALFDKDGNFTAIPTIENLGLRSGEIIWDKTFIKTSTYHPYNYKRQTKEYTRVCINKGSVIALVNCKDDFKEKIGAFINEGFGDIIINPKFLDQKNPILTKYIKETQIQKSDSFDKNLISFLENKHQKENNLFDVSSDVQKIYKDLIGPSKSQWGQIRTFATISKNKEDLIAKIEEYISKGVAKKQWEDKKTKLLTQINNNPKPLEFTKLLAMIVSKHTQGGKDGK